MGNDDICSITPYGRQLLDYFELQHQAMDVSLALERAHFLARRGMLHAFLRGGDLPTHVKVVDVGLAGVKKPPAPEKA